MKTKYYRKIDESNNKITDHHIIRVFDDTLVVMNNEFKWGIINLNSKNVLDVQCSCKFDDINEFIDGKAIFKIESHYGIVNNYGDIIVKDKYISIVRKNDYFLVYPHQGCCGLLNKDGQVILDCNYDQIYIRGNYIEVRKDNLEGLFDKQGNELIPPAFNAIEVVSDHYAILYSNDKEKIIDIDSGKEVLDYACLNIHYLGPNCLLIQDLKQRYKIVDFTGKQIKKFKKNYKTLFDYIHSNHQNMFIHNHRDLMDFDGNELLKDQEYLEFCQDGVITTQDNKYRLLDFEMNTIIDNYDDIEQITPGIYVCEKDHQKEVYINSSGHFIKKSCLDVKKEGNNIVLTGMDNIKYLYDLKGNKIETEKYTNIISTVSNLLRVTNISGLKGIINSTGQVIVEPNYDKIGAYGDNFFKVCKNGKYYIINRQEKIIASLDNDLLNYLEYYSVKDDLFLVRNINNEYFLFDHDEVLMERKKIDSLFIINSNQIIINNCLMNPYDIKYKYCVEYKGVSGLEVKEFDTDFEAKEFLQNIHYYLKKELETFKKQIIELSSEYNNALKDKMDSLINYLYEVEEDQELINGVREIASEHQIKTEKINDETNKKIIKITQSK